MKKEKKEKAGVEEGRKSRDKDSVGIVDKVVDGRPIDRNKQGQAGVACTQGSQRENVQQKPCDSVLFLPELRHNQLFTPCFLA